ncbi:hypothetical protein ACJX0J_036954, partial [Zea mays]
DAYDSSMSEFFFYKPYFQNYILDTPNIIGEKIVHGTVVGHLFLFLMLVIEENHLKEDALVAEEDAAEELDLDSSNDFSLYKGMLISLENHRKRIIKELFEKYGIYYLTGLNDSELLSLRIFVINFEDQTAQREAGT